MKHHPRDWYNLSKAERKAQINKTVAFIKNLGHTIHPYNSCPDWQKGIIDHIKIYEGLIYADLKKVHLGDLIHEFCHVWVAPEHLRPKMSHWLKVCENENGEEMAEVVSYAIAKHLQIDTWIVLSVVSFEYEYSEKK